MLQYRFALWIDPHLISSSTSTFVSTTLGSKVGVLPRRRKHRSCLQAGARRLLAVKLLQGRVFGGERALEQHIDDRRPSGAGSMHFSRQRLSPSDYLHHLGSTTWLRIIHWWVHFVLVLSERLFFFNTAPDLLDHENTWIYISYARDVQNVELYKQWKKLQLKNFKGTFLQFSGRHLLHWTPLCEHSM